MNDRTIFSAGGVVGGMVFFQLVKFKGERPPLFSVPSILVGLTFGCLMWLIYPLILG